MVGKTGMGDFYVIDSGEDDGKRKVPRGDMALGLVTGARHPHGCRARPCSLFLGAVRQASAARTSAASVARRGKEISRLDDGSRPIALSSQIRLGG